MPVSAFVYITNMSFTEIFVIQHDSLQFVWCLEWMCKETVPANQTKKCGTKVCKGGRQYSTSLKGGVRKLAGTFELHRWFQQKQLKVSAKLKLVHQEQCYLCSAWSDSLWRTVNISPNRTCVNSQNSNANGIWLLRSPCLPSHEPHCTSLLCKGSCV